MIPAEDSLSEALAAYHFAQPLVGAVRYGFGHINDTFCVHTQPLEGDGQRYILQRLNSSVFPRPDEVMENMRSVTDFLRRVLQRSGEDPMRGTLNLLSTKQQKDYFTDSKGGVWRLTYFIEGTKCLQQVQRPEDFYASGRAFGRFQRLLEDYPAQTLHEVIAQFHDTEHRFRKFSQAQKADVCGRAAAAQREIAFILAREQDCSVCMQAVRDGVLPLRVTHNDTKLNNVLLDRQTGAGVCVIDLDTVMPGLAINDFGDAIRFGANHCREDEPDLSRVSFDLSLYEVYAKGFLEEAGGVLTEAERTYLPWGAKLMTLECGMRFLTDYLEGDAYFRTTRDGQNLDRCRTQLKLVSDMEACWEQMTQITKK